MKRYRPGIFAAILLFITIGSIGQIPPGYYDPANGKTGTALQAALHNIIKGHTVVTYAALWTWFQSTDKKANGTVWDTYSDVPGGTPPYVYQFGSDQCGNYSSEGDCYNREHSWPKSWFGGDIEPMYTDIFHLYPTDGYVNGRRSDYPYGEVTTATWTSLNGSKLGNCTWPGYSG
ncbi:MAG: endonuclease, partial [Bacteroidota bacterium]